MRLAVEVQTARLAVARATPAQMADLTSLLARLDAMAGSTQPPRQRDAYAVLDLEFHSALAEASENRLLGAAMEVLYHYLVHRTVPVSAAQQQQLNRSLRTLLDCGIRAGNADVAAEAMAQHLADSYRVMAAARSGGTPDDLLDAAANSCFTQAE